MDILFRNSRRKLSQGLLFWREAGEGIPVVFLHGAWNDSSQWVSVMKSLSEKFHCLAPDLLGFGESENPKIHYSIDLQVESIAEFLEAVKLEKVYLVGYSIGGWIAASYALKYPEQIAGLVLLSPEGVGIDGQEKNWQKMRTLLNRPPLLLKILKLLHPVIKKLGWQNKIEKDWSWRQKLLQYPTACQLLFQRRQSEIEAELLNSRLHLMEVPVLILQGGQALLDDVVRSQTYTQLIPKVDLKIIAHAGNDLSESCTGVVVEDIINFVDSNYL
ncbi:MULTISPECIES: alpha/beta fold hydrolase [unclassified Anabaena]|uniref:alpha/beta fold hydrolase n=1 Tax=unclassified Anabaena TaxID=2619674 RepID=UPI0039C611D8